MASFEIEQKHEERLQELLCDIATDCLGIRLEEVSESDFQDEAYYADITTAIEEYLEFLKNKYFKTEEICHECGFIDCQCPRKEV